MEGEFACCGKYCQVIAHPFVSWLESKWCFLYYTLEEKRELTKWLFMIFVLNGQVTLF